MTATQTSKKIELSWIVVKDLDEGIKFYTEVVGLELKTHEPMFGWAEFAGPDGGARLGMCQANEEMGMVAGTNSVVCLTVQDIEEAKKEMAAKGCSLVGDVVEVPGMVKLQSFEDSSGNHMQLVENL